MSGRRRALAVLAVGTLLLAPPRPAGATAAGAVVPFFKALDVRGRQVSLGDLAASKRVVVFFWDYLRATSTREMNALERLFMQYGPVGLDVLAVEGRGASPEQTVERLEKLRAIGTEPHYTVLPDPGGRIARQFGVESAPQLFLVNGAGRVAWALEDFRSGDEAVLEERVKEFLGLAPPPPPPVQRADARPAPAERPPEAAATPPPREADPRTALLERYRYYGNYHLNRKEPARAEEFFRKYLELEPRDVSILLRTGEALAAMGAYDRAREVWETVQRLDPGNQEADANIRRLIRGEF
jgi:tetratricopeptide (TPR) repeat protein